MCSYSHLKVVTSLLDGVDSDSAFTLWCGGQMAERGYFNCRAREVDHKQYFSSLLFSFRREQGYMKNFATTSFPFLSTRHWEGSNPTRLLHNMPVGSTPSQCVSPSAHKARQRYMGYTSGMSADDSLPRTFSYWFSLTSPNIS
jgi:hypothetical protein